MKKPLCDADCLDFASTYKRRAGTGPQFERLFAKLIVASESDAIGAIKSSLLGIRELLRVDFVHDFFASSFRS